MNVCKVLCSDSPNIQSAEVIWPICFSEKVAEKTLVTGTFVINANRWPDLQDVRVRKDEY